MRTRIVLCVLVTALLASGFGFGVWVGPEVSTWLRVSAAAAPAGARPDLGLHRVAALGRLRPTDGVVSVVGPPGDRVKALYVRQGQEVDSGASLVLLDSAADRQQEERLARKQREEGEQTLASIERSQRARMGDIDLQLANLDTTEQLEVDAHDLKIDLLRKRVAAIRTQQRRLASLNRAVVHVSQEETDQVDQALTQARGQRDAAGLEREGTRKKYRMQRKAIRSQQQLAQAEFDLARVHVPLESLKQAEALAHRRVEQSTLKSPVRGRVLRTLTREGDSIGPAPLLELAAGNRMMVVAEVYASDVARIKRWLEEGRAVDVWVSSTALGKGVRLHGQVSDQDAIARVVAHNTVVAPSPRSDGDRRVIEVQVPLDSSAVALASRFIELEVNVTFEPGKPQRGSVG
jgi:HlyD family secretion protein